MTNSITLFLFCTVVVGFVVLFYNTMKLHTCYEDQACRVAKLTHQVRELSMTDDEREIAKKMQDAAAALRNSTTPDEVCLTVDKLPVEEDAKLSDLDDIVKALEACTFSQPAAEAEDNCPKEEAPAAPVKKTRGPSAKRKAAETPCEQTVDA